MTDFQFYIQLFIICLLSTILTRYLLTKNHKNKVHHKQNVPPSPPSLPIIGHLHLISSFPHQSFHHLSTRYGPIMRISLGSLPCVVVSTPEAAKEFLKTNEAQFLNRFSGAAVRYLSYDLKGFLFAQYGSYWKFMKKIIMSELLGGRTLDQLLPLRRSETINFLKGLRKRGEAGEGVDVGGELMTLTSSTISRMTMSKSCYEGGDNAEEDIRAMVRDTSELAGKFNVSDFIWFCKNYDLQGMNKRLKGIHDRFDSMVERVIKEHQEERKRNKENNNSNKGTKDLLDMLLDIHEDQSTEIQLTIENIKALILDIFMAGTDTSAITTEWALAELINHPHVMDRARKEIDSVTENKRLIQESDVPNLPYMRAIVKETLRLHPAAPLLGRESSEPANVCGYDIPARTILFVNLWSMGRDPKIWDDPLEFRPERLLGEQQHLDLRGQYFQLMPFGTGRRACPGATLALEFVPVNLAAMVQCFDWDVGGGGGGGALDMEEGPGITLRRAHPLTCIPLPRLDCVPFYSVND